MSWLMLIFMFEGLFFLIFRFFFPVTLVEEEVFLFFLLGFEELYSGTKKLESRLPGLIVCYLLVFRGIGASQSFSIFRSGSNFVAKGRWLFEFLI